MKIVLASLLVAGAIQAIAAKGRAADPLEISPGQLRAVARAYDDLRSARSGGKEGESGLNFRAVVSERYGRFEILFSHPESDGIERRGGGWLYVVDSTGLRMIERRPQK